MNNEQFTRILLVQRLEELQQLNSRTDDMVLSKAIGIEMTQVNTALKELSTEESVNK